MSRWDFGKLLGRHGRKVPKRMERHPRGAGRKGRAGDLDAIRLYRETMAQAGSGNEVTIVDDI